MGILLVLVLAIVAIVLFFSLPGSRSEKEFKALAQVNFAPIEDKVSLFSQEDIASLPPPVQRYFIHCGFIGKPKMQVMKASFKDVAFSLGRGKPTVKIDYTQYNSVRLPNRIAYIDSSLYGIPFEGIDAYIAGKGSMKGVLARFYTFFNLKGAEMDSASLVTMLSECLLIPTVALAEYVHWEAIDDTHAKATIEYYGIQCSGIFTFNQEGEMEYFTTDDRTAASLEDGSMERVRWTIHCSDYKRIDGLLLPTVMQAIWNYSEGDLLYFDSNNGTIEYFN
jgi:hypothetical protein